LSQSSSVSRPFLVVAVVAVLFVIVLQLGFAANRNSITWDEDDHIWAGYNSWKHLDYGINPEHPPLVKLVATLPLFNMPLRLPQIQDRNFKIEAFLDGKDFLFKNDANAMLLRVRLAAMVFTVITVLLVFFAAREMFGDVAALIAIGLLAFDPTVLAHGAVLGTDMGLTCMMFASVYAFYRYVKAPSIARLLIVGLAAGLALTTKHTGILVCPILCLLALIELIRQGRPSLAKNAGRFTLALVAIAAVAIIVLWAAYGFRYSARPAGTQMNPPLAEFLQGLSRPRDVKLLSTVARFHLLPESYIYGLADVRIMSDFYSSFLLGRTYPHGVWFYFPVTVTIKSSLSFLILLGITIAAIATGKFRRWREILFLTIPPIFYFLIAMGSGMNIGVRHILPVYIFSAVLIGGVMSSLIERQRAWAYAVMALLVFQAISVARTYPAYLAYANELWGGPANVHNLISDSNADWGQQLKDVKRYLDQRGVKDCWFLYFAEGVVDYSYYGIPCKPLPSMDSLWVNEPANAPPSIDGTVLISAGNLSGFEFGEGPLNPYERFKSVKPTAVIDYGVFVYDGHFDIPFAASIGHSQKAEAYLASKNYPEALSEAQQAVALAPNAVQPNALMGDALTALNRPAEAKPYYQKALKLAQTVEPEFQVGWVEGLEKKVAANR
jgi:4-amino-4-deoxy-L-arabinose transferase-like glycosyltransferase